MVDRERDGERERERDKEGHLGKWKGGSSTFMPDSLEEISFLGCEAATAPNIFFKKRLKEGEKKRRRRRRRGRGRRAKLDKPRNKKRNKPKNNPTF